MERGRHGISLEPFVLSFPFHSFLHSVSDVILTPSFIVIFQFGWAAVQIAHLSLIPDLTACSDERTEINAWRYAGTVISNVIVYSVIWALLGLDDDDSGSQDSHHVCPSDAPRFRDLVLIVVGIGVVFSIIFHVFVKERSSKNYKRLPEKVSEDDTISIVSLDYSLPANHLKWKHWFLVPQFYKVSFLYMTTRLCINLTQTYIPFYLQESLNLKRVSSSQLYKNGKRIPIYIFSLLPSLVYSVRFPCHILSSSCSHHSHQ